MLYQVLSLIKRLISAEVQGNRTTEEELKDIFQGKGISLQSTKGCAVPAKGHGKAYAKMSANLFPLEK